jgi:hypothetical protein
LNAAQQRKVADMGAWGHGSFENDDAADWLSELEDRGVAAVSSVLEHVTQFAENGYLEAPEASRAIAAAELIAAARDGDLTRLSEAAKVELAKHQQSLISPSLRGLAHHATTRVLKQSELRELWEEGQEGVIWLKEMNSLLERLK